MRPDKPTITAVIPTLDEEANLAAAITNLKAAGFDEIIVCDGGSADGTRDIAASFEGVDFVSTTRGRGWQLAAGVAAATSPVIAMVHADCRLPGDAGEAIRRVATDGAVAGGCFRVAFDQPGLLMGLYGWFSRFDTPFTTFGDQVIFARRDVLIATGGVPEIPLFEDVVLRKRLRRAGRFVKLRRSVLTSARRYRRHGVLATQALNGLLLVAFLAGWPASSLYRLYYGVPAGPVDRYELGSHSPGGSNPSVS
jgi:rSAM/selenodomain-associated transferase 2